MLVEVGVEFLEALPFLDEFFVECEKVVCCENGLPLDGLQVRGTREADMEGVPLEIVELVGAEVSVRDPCGKRLFAFEHVLEELDIAAAVGDGRVHSFQAEQPPVVVVLFEHGFDLVGAWAVAEVVQQGEKLQRALLFRLKMLNANGLAGAGQNSQRVFKARMLRAREDQVVQAELPTVPEALEKRMVDDREILADLDWAGTWYAD